MLQKRKDSAQHQQTTVVHDEWPSETLHEGRIEGSNGKGKRGHDKCEGYAGPTARNPDRDEIEDR